MEIEDVETTGQGRGQGREGLAPVAIYDRSSIVGRPAAEKTDSADREAMPCLGQTDWKNSGQVFPDPGGPSIIML